MDSLFKIELYIVFALIALSTLLGMMWFYTKNKKLEKILNQLKQLITSLLQYI